jgi:uncharacterized protein YndB with AHSA1/START domain
VGSGRCLVLAATLAAAPTAALAEVVAQAREGFIVAHDVILDAAPERAFAALTEEVSGWWDAGHSYSGEAGNFTLDARAGGCFCERLANGGSVEHMRVVFSSPGAMLRMEGGLGPLQGIGASGTMTFTFSPEGDATRLAFRYSVSGFVPDGLASMAEPVDRVLGGQLARLAAHLAGETSLPR